MFRRLLQCFEQRVEGAGGQHVDLIDDVDPVFALGRRVADLVPDLTDVVHTVVGSRVDLDEVEAGFRLPAQFTLVAGVAIDRVQAVDRPGKDLGHGGLAGAAGAAEQVGMAVPVVDDLVAQCSDHRFLPYDLVKCL